MTLLFVVIALALVFDYINGFHDAANSIATVVSTKVLTPVQAVLWAAAFNFIAFFVFRDLAVANTIGKTVNVDFITLPVILSGLIAACTWNLLTWWFGIPSSSSHTLIGGFAGAGIAHAFAITDGFTLKEVVDLPKITTTLMFIFLAPLLGMCIAIGITLVTMMRNVWARVGLMIIAAMAVWMTFGYFQQNKLEENLSKHFKVDDLKKKSEKDPAIAAVYEKAKARLEAAQMHLPSFSQGGGALVAQQVKAIDLDVDEAKLAKDLDKSDNHLLRYSIMGMMLIFILAYLYVEKLKSPTARTIANMFKRLQLLSSAAFSLGHGSNDAQKVMGIIAAAMVAAGTIGDIKEMPVWVPLACHAAIALGTLSGGWRIVKTMGTRITKVTPLEGVCAETAGAFTLFFTEQAGIPVSTTHTITGAIIGVGATKRVSAVRWGITIQLLWAWILTIPVSALLAGLVYWICTLTGLE